MTSTTTSTFHRTARLGVCVLIGAAAFTACGETDGEVAVGPGVASPTPVVAYVSPEQADREALLAVRAAHASADALERRSAAKAPRPYVAPEQADREALLALRAERASADAMERRAEQAAALERPVPVEQPSAHPSADALERWALSDSEG